MTAETEECPCWNFVDDDVKPGFCLVCGDRHDEHEDGTGKCRCQHRLDEPYDPEATLRALRMVQDWEWGKKDQ